MQLSDEARKARSAYYRELRKKRLSTPEGRKREIERQEAYWRKKALEMRVKEAAEAAAK